MKVVLWVLFTILILAMFIIANKEIINKSKNKEKIAHYKKVLTSIDKARNSNLNFIMSANVHYALDKIIEDALTKLIGTTPFNALYKHRLKALVRKNKKYSVKTKAKKNLVTLNIYGKNNIYNISFVTQISKLRKLLKGPIVSRVLPRETLLAEDRALEFIQTRITLESSLDKATVALELGYHSKARESIERARNFLLREGIDKSYRVKCLTQIKNLEAMIKASRFPERLDKSAADLRKEKEWELLFARNKRSIDLHF